MVISWTLCLEYYGDLASTARVLFLSTIRPRFFGYMVPGGYFLLSLVDKCMLKRYDMLLNVVDSRRMLKIKLKTL